MSDSNSRSAWLEDVKAYRLGSELWFVGTAQVSSPCDIAFVEQSPLRIFPPQFVLRQRKGPMVEPGAKCLAIISKVGFHSPAPSERGFYFPTDQATVLLGDHSGVKEVAITEIRRAMVHGLDGGGGGEGQPDPLAIPAALKDKLEIQTSYGYSATYDLAEAINDALKHMPPSPPGNVADALTYFHVASIGVEVGGFAGLDRMRVALQTVAAKATKTK